MLPVYYRKANGVILVYDVTSKQSFEEVKEWINGMYVYVFYGKQLRTYVRMYVDTYCTCDFSCFSRTVQKQY